MPYFVTLLCCTGWPLLPVGHELMSRLKAKLVTMSEWGWSKYFHVNGEQSQSLTLMSWVTPGGGQSPGTMKLVGQQSRALLAWPPETEIGGEHVDGDVCCSFPRLSKSSHSHSYEGWGLYKLTAFGDRRADAFARLSFCATDASLSTQMHTLYMVSSIKQSQRMWLI